MFARLEWMRGFEKFKSILRQFSKAQFDTRHYKITTEL